VLAVHNGNISFAEVFAMKSVLSVLLLSILTVQAQSPSMPATAAESIQLSPANSAGLPQGRELKIPAGTPVEIETAYTVNSQYVRPEDLISFRVVVPIKVGGVTVVDKYSLVTGRVVEAKPGGHWGKAGKLSWIMQDVVATDLTRVPLQARNDSPAENRMTGTSHGGEVATQIAISAPFLLFAAPLALTAGFKRGENAMLPEGKRFIVFVKSDTVIHANDAKALPSPSVVP
jgi:hypothetical protein